MCYVLVNHTTYCACVRQWGEDMKVINGKRIMYRDIVINELITRDGSKCKICNKNIDDRQTLEIDHIIPLRLRGDNSFNNLQLVHKSCHRQKDNELRKAHPKAKVSNIKYTPQHKQKISTARQEYYRNIQYKAMELLSLGMSKVDIAKHMDVSRPTVYDILRRAV